MGYLLSLVDIIPNVIWSGIIASFLTFIGVLWTNKGAEKRQQMLLAYEKEKFQSQQKLDLKKEVFMGLSSHFSNTLSVVIKLINLEITQKEIEKELTKQNSFVANSYLVASEKSVAEILEFSAEIGEILLKLMPIRTILLDHKKAIQIYGEGIKKANEEKNRIISIMKEFNLQGRNDKTTFDYLDRDYKFQESIVNENTQLMENEQEELGGIHRDFCKKCIEEHSRLISLLPAMTILLRNELENETNSEALIDAFIKNVKRMKLAFSKLFND